MERQSIEEDDLVRAIQLGRSPSQFWKQINYAEKALSEITGSPISKKRVDWRACGIAWYSTDIWLHRTGAVAPSTVHADAPGPFGRFLQDVLDLLYTASHLTPPSARSAMRALSNITKDGAEFALNW